MANQIAHFIGGKKVNDAAARPIAILSMGRVASRHFRHT